MFDFDVVTGPTHGVVQPVPAPAVPQPAVPVPALRAPAPLSRSPMPEETPDARRAA
ncbi:hypothetical protein STVA_09750 [Allostella vacuolata]|nr:hypothetical protein STVA_09750 [Stella vacuolata]